MMISKDLLNALGLPKEVEDEETVGTAIVALVTSAVHDERPQNTLSDVHRLIVDFGGSQYLNALYLVPLLLPPDDTVARDILSIAAECGSAKEVVMATQEALERLERLFQNEEDDEPNTESPNFKAKTLADQLLTSLDLLAASIPRIKLRKKSASETLKIPLGELQIALARGANRVSGDSGKDIVLGVANLVNIIWKWVLEVKISEEDSNASKVVLRSVLEKVIVTYAHCIDASVAQRSLEKHFPRLRLRSSVPPGWVTGDKAISELEAAYRSLDIPLVKPTGMPSEADLVFLAHRLPEEGLDETTLARFTPILVSSLQNKTLLDEALAILIDALSGTQRCGSTLPSDISIPLYSVVPIVTSAHPNPTIRHQAFRILSLLVSCSDVQITFQNLLELTQNPQFPQMRVASVGLVKEAVLKGLSGTKKDNPFSGSLFLRGFGPVLFRPNPPELLQSDDLTLEEFTETHEPERLTECLSLFYVLLQRDERNLTGIRDKSTIRTLDTNLLGPLKSHLTRWIATPAHHRLHEVTPVASLQISIERIEAAQAVLLRK